MVNVKQAKKYCCEDISLIENYTEAIADKTQTWDIHHRAEILPCGRYTKAQLEKHGLYWNVPASQLIFLKHSEHRRLHNLNMSDEIHTKRCIALGGENNPMYGKHHSSETRAKLSNAAKIAQHKPEVLAKQRAAKKGKHWWNNRIVQLQAFECPKGFVAGRLRS